MKTCGYRLREVAQIADRKIQVYEKPLDPKYTITAAQPPSLSPRGLIRISEILNDVVLIDGFDKDHKARRSWAEALETSDHDNYAIYYRLREKSKLRLNRIQSIYSILSNIELDVKDLKNKELLVQFKKLYEGLSKFAQSKPYHDLSLGEKVLYMEEVDRLLAEIIDLLR